MPMGFAIPATGEARDPVADCASPFWAPLAFFQDSIFHSSCACLCLQFLFTLRTKVTVLESIILVTIRIETRLLYAGRDVANPPPVILVLSLGDPPTSAMPAPRNNGVVSPSPPSV